MAEEKEFDKLAKEMLGNLLDGFGQVFSHGGKIRGWKPQGKTAPILDRAMEHIKSVEYKVSARWVFYRLLQEGHYSDKNDYKNKFIPMTSVIPPPKTRYSQQLL